MIGGYRSNTSTRSTFAYCQSTRVWCPLNIHRRDQSRYSADEGHESDVSHCDLSEFVRLSLLPHRGICLAGLTS